MARGPAEAFARREVVELDDDAVDLVAEIVPAGLEVGVIGEDLVHRPRLPDPLVDLEPPAAQGGEHVPLTLEAFPVVGEDVVGVEVEGAGGGELGIELAHGAGGGVAGIGERLLALGDQLLVELVEGGGKHDDLAAHGEEGRSRELAVTQPQRDAGDGADVGRDPLAPPSVAAGRGLQQGAVPVDQLDGEAVELGLEDVLHGNVRSQALAHPLVEAAQRRLGLVGLQRQHGSRVLDSGKGVDGPAGYALSGGILGDEIGKLLLQRDQLPIQPVVLFVGDLGSVFDVVEVVVMADRGAQLVDPPGGFVAGHPSPSDAG